MPKKSKELVYEKFDRVARWNYIQRISSFILESSISNEELESILINIDNGTHRLELVLNQK